MEPLARGCFEDEVGQEDQPQKEQDVFEGSIDRSIRVNQFDG
jgi:hypothetical protein